jgi:hypothetical protein
VEVRNVRDRKRRHGLSCIHLATNYMEKRENQGLEGFEMLG